MAWLYKRRESKKWWIGWRVGGKAYFRSTGTPDRAKANEELARVNLLFAAKKSGSLTEELYRLLSGKTIPKVTLRAALADWVAEAKASTSPQTLVKYDVLSRHFAAYMQATEQGPLLADIATEHVRAFLNKERETKSASTVNLSRKILSGFFIRAIKNGVLRENPCLPVKPFKAGRGEKQSRRAFTLTEVKLMFGKAPDDFWRYMILGGFYLGQRLGDLICASWGAVDFNRNVFALVQGKTGNRVEIPLAAPLREHLLKLHNAAGNPKATAYIWPEQAARYIEKGSGTFSGEFYEVVLAPSGLVPARADKQAHKQGRAAKREATAVSFHCFRHTFVSLLKITGAVQGVAKELAGHSSDLISDNYSHMPQDVLAKAIRKLPEVTK